VYTAFHGEGEWELRPLAPSLHTFGEAMRLFSEISIDRENPMKLEKNPISREEKEKILSKLEKLDFGDCIGFWEDWLNF
jgi:hypothetical protein